jgi:hypothetical protein
VAKPTGITTPRRGGGKEMHLIRMLSHKSVKLENKGLLFVPGISPQYSFLQKELKKFPNLY